MRNLIEGAINIVKKNPVKAGTAVLGGGLLTVSTACGSNESPTPDDIKSPTPTVEVMDTLMPSQTTELTPSPSVTDIPTTEPTLGATQTEIVQSEPCIILPDEYCSQGKLVDWTNPATGQQLKLITVNLPEGTSIRTPISGSVTFTEGPGNTIDPKIPAIFIYNPDNPSQSITIAGDIQVKDGLLNADSGNIIAQSANTGKAILGSTIAIVFSDENLARKSFPNLF